MRIDRIAVAAAAVCTCSLVAAQASSAPEQILGQLRHAYPGTQFSAVKPSPVPGLFEVWMGDNVAYVSAQEPRYFVVGRVIDMATLTDLTGPRLPSAGQALGAATNDRPVAVDRLEHADAIQTVKGDGSRPLYVFSDPACSYCRRLEAELDKVSNVTLYTFLVPFQGVELPRAIWCAADRQRAYRDAMLRGDKPKAQTANCDTPLDRNLQLAQELGVVGTPTIVYADGSRSDGYVDATELEQRIAAAAGVPETAAKTVEPSARGTPASASAPAPIKEIVR
jgi:thiol:disulfide interchange protein DsbC